MFIPKDTRKVLEILYAENEDRSKLKLGRREAEFNNDTKLLTAPERSTTLTTTKYLSLYGNKLNKLSYFKTLANHQTLEELNLGYNELSELPTSLGDILSLKRIWLEDNLLGPKFPSSLLKLTNLTTLTLSGNHIQEIPETIQNLTHLEELSIASNQLSSLPYGIGSLTKLRTLILRGNTISSLPFTIGQLSNLELLSINSNQLTTLPSSIGNCINLTTVYLNSNHLITLPSTMVQNKKLKKLNIAFNSIQFLPLSLISAWEHKLDPVIVKAAVVLIKQYIRENLSSITTNTTSSPNDLLSQLATYGSIVQDTTSINLSSTSPNTNISTPNKDNKSNEHIHADDLSLDIHYRTRKSINNNENTNLSTEISVTPMKSTTDNHITTKEEQDEEFIPDTSLRITTLQDLNINDNPIIRLAFGANYDEGFRPSHYRTPLVDEIRKRTKK